MSRKTEYELLPNRNYSDGLESSSSSEEETFFTSPSLKYPPNIAKHVTPSFCKKNCTTKCYIIIGVVCLSVLVLTLLLVVILFGLLPTRISNANTSTVRPFQSKKLEWNRFFNTSAGFGLLEHDINQDGISDLIFDTRLLNVGGTEHLSCSYKPDNCLNEPCSDQMAQLLALDGSNGTIIWQRWINFSPTAANCDHDLTLDGVEDCCLSGESGLLVVIDVIDGSYVWFSDPAVTFPLYSFMSPLFIQDFDRDGIIDLIVTHGGEPGSLGFIFVLSGRTGQQLSDRIPMPDGHETHTSPVAFNISKGTEIILFGSGGKTTSGSLWGITTNSFQIHVDNWTPNRNPKYIPHRIYLDPKCPSMQYIINSTRPKVKEDIFKYTEAQEDWMVHCSVWNKDSKVLWNPYHVCAFEIASTSSWSTTAGIIQPPVILANLNGEGTNDLLVIRFNAQTILFTGGDSTILWNYKANHTQSYSIPAPLNYNEDNKIDILARFHTEEWMKDKRKSFLSVLNGESGESLWTLNCSYGTISSPLTLKNKLNGHDGMLFIAAGCAARTDDVAATVKTTSRERHEEEEEEETSLGSGYGIHSETSSSSPTDPSFSDISGNIPADLFLNNVSDSEEDGFPDPWTETRSFIQEYCGIPYNDMITSVYFLTPNMIESGYIRPIYENKPYVYKVPSTDGYSTTAEKSKNSTQPTYSRKILRCAYVLIPTQVQTTPVVGDFDSDGRLDAAVTVTYDGVPNDKFYSTLASLHPSTLSVKVFNIEDRLLEVFGPEINKVVNFNEYLPTNHQPWLKYMGSRIDIE